MHMAPYADLIDAGARTIMGSYSSWQGERVHGRQDVMTGLLRDELGFEGLLLSDGGAVDQIDDDYATAVVTAVNAGVGMNMVPHDARRWISTLEGAIADGEVSEERIDEAVERILTVKFEIGLFEQPFAQRDLPEQVGSEAHRALAREAARASVTTLVGGELFPLATDAGRVVVSGQGADDVGMQAGAAGRSSGRGRRVRSRRAPRSWRVSSRPWAATPRWCTPSTGGATAWPISASLSWVSSPTPRGRATTPSPRWTRRTWR